MTFLRPKQEQKPQSNPSSSDKPPDKPSETPPLKNLLQLFQWIILIVLILWSLSIFWSPTQTSVKLPYSTFLDQVRADNVTKVDISGSQIEGSFQTALLWPPVPVTTTATSTISTSTTSANTTSADTTPVANLSTPLATAAANVTSTAQLTATALQSQSLPYMDFSTNFPADLGDSTLLPLLESHNVVVNVSPTSVPWLTLLLTTGLPILLLLFVFGFMGRKMMNQQSNIFGFGNSGARQHVVSNYPEVTFKDVAGADEAKADLSEIVDFLKEPTRYHQLGARMPRGVLLVGAPGTGKTLLARAVAGEAGVPFFNLNGSEFVEMFVGVGASRVRDLFHQAKESGSAIIFIDELDAVGRRRGAGLGNTNDEREQTLNQLLVEMDGFDEHHDLIVMAATNRPDVLDPALLRPGRFDRQVVVSLPDLRGRAEILRIHSTPLPVATDVDLNKLAQATVGMSGADLANLCNEAALGAARQRHSQVTMSDFESAIDKVVLGSERPLVMSEQARRIVAYHEAGHAVVAWLLPEADPVNKVTIIPHGRALGVTEQLPSEEQYNYNRLYLLTRLSVMLGGRTAEEVAIGDITTGAENDLVEATRMTRRMITRWGMSDIGLAAFESDETQPFLGYELSQGRSYSEDTSARIDQTVQKILRERHQSVTQLLTQNRRLLDALAQALLAHETVQQAQLVAILGQRPQPAHSDSPPESAPTTNDQ